MGQGHQEWSRAGCIKHTEVIVRFRGNPTGRVVVGVVCKHRHVEREHMFLRVEGPYEGVDIHHVGNKALGGSATSRAV